MAYDIQNAIIDKLIDLYTEDMQTDVDEDDDLRLTTIERGPLQDDPTLAAPLVIIAFDSDHGRIPDPFHEAEFGLGQKWMNFFKIGGKISQQDTKALAYSKIGEFNDRMLAVIRKHWDLSDVTATSGEIVWACSPQLIGQNSVRVYGGEGEWFGEAKILIHFFTTDSAAMWSHS